MELYFGAQYVTVTAKGLNESANLDDDKNLLATKMEKLFTVDSSILTHVLDPSQYALTEPVLTIINSTNITDSSTGEEVVDASTNGSKDEAEEAPETGEQEGGKTGGEEGEEGGDVYNEKIYGQYTPNSEARESVSQDSNNLYQTLLGKTSLVQWNNFPK